MTFVNGATGPAIMAITLRGGRTNQFHEIVVMNTGAGSTKQPPRRIPKAEKSRLQDVGVNLRASREELDAILRAVADGITVEDRFGHFVYVNDAAARVTGFASAEAMIAAAPSEILKGFMLMDEHGEPFPRENLPSWRAFAGERGQEAAVRFKNLRTGEERVSIVRSEPILDPDGQVQFVVNAFQDITQLKWQERRSRFLAEAGRILSSSLDYETTLQRVVQLAVPELADWAAVDLIDESGEIRRLATAHVDPNKVKWAEELARTQPPDPAATSGVPQVIRTGEAEFYPDLDQAWLESLVQSDEEREILRILHLRSVMIVPLFARGRTLGAITLVQAESERLYTADDLVAANGLATRAALAVDNARLYREAQNALTTREDFFSSISHDLRTPLTTIKGMAEILLRQTSRRPALDSGPLSEQVLAIERAAAQMGAMVDEVLDITRLEANRPLDLKPESIDLVEVVHQVAAELRRTAGHHEIQIDATCDTLIGDWDPLRLGRVVGNLLSNAIKYSSEEAGIHVTL